MTVRMTTHMPIGGWRIGPTLWWGSIERGWTGKPFAPWRWSLTYRVSGVSEADLVPQEAENGRG